MSQLFPYICTRQTADPTLPPYASNIVMLARDTSDGFAALVGGYLRAGQITFYSVQFQPDSHLLCDGSEVDKLSFPELYDIIGDSEGVASDGMFKLPNFIGSLPPAEAADPVEVDGGSVGSGTDQPDDPAETGGTRDGSKDSGGRHGNGDQNR